MEFRRTIANFVKFYGLEKQNIQNFLIGYVQHGSQLGTGENYLSRKNCIKNNLGEKLLVGKMAKN